MQVYCGRSCHPSWGYTCPWLRMQRSWRRRSDGRWILCAALPHTSEASWQIGDNVLELSPCLEPCIVLQSMKTMAAASLLPSQSHATLLLWLMLTLKPCRILKNRYCSAGSIQYKVTTLPHSPGIKSALKAEGEKEAASVSLLSLVPVSFIRKAGFPEVPR